MSSTIFGPEMRPQVYFDFDLILQSVYTTRGYKIYKRMYDKISPFLHPRKRRVVTRIHAVRRGYRYVPRMAYDALHGKVTPLKLNGREDR